MAIYSTDFSADTIGSLPSGWVVEYTSGSSNTYTVVANGSKKEFRLYNSSLTPAAVAELSYSPAGTSSNSETLALVSSPGDSVALRLLTRYSSINPDFYSTTAWEDAGSLPPEFVIQKANPTYSNLTGFYANIVTSDDYYWVRSRANGTTVSMKIWKSTAPEPSAWTASVTDSSLSSGKVGIQFAKRFQTEAVNVHIQYFAAATAGETVPVPYAYMAPAKATHSLVTDSPQVDVPGDPGYVILGGWGSSVWGLSYAGSGSNLSTPEIGAVTVTHTITSDTVTLVEDVPLLVADSTHGLTSDTSPLGVGLLVADALHGLVSDQAQVKANAIVPSKSHHGITSESPVLFQAQVISPNETVHALISDAFGLNQDYHLALNPSLHTVGSDNAALIQDYHLLVQDATQEMYVDNGTVYIAFAPGSVTSGNFDPRLDPTPGLYEEGQLTPSGEYIPRARAVGAWQEAAGPEVGSWNSP